MHPVPKAAFVWQRGRWFIVPSMPNGSGRSKAGGEEEWFVAEQHDDGQERPWWQCMECPMKEYCSAKSFKEANLWSYESEAKCREYIARHLHGSGLHKLTPQDCEAFSEAADVQEMLETYDCRCEYRARLQEEADKLAKEAELKAVLAQEKEKRLREAEEKRQRDAPHHRSDGHDRDRSRRRGGHGHHGRRVHSPPRHTCPPPPNPADARQGMQVVHAHAHHLILKRL